CQQHKSYPWTF
nr:immunoglobulin light chain junction region [Macaca mulatta]MOW10461.1 immunoglobulin light chain junction region [Macaca mulatta]MOW12879.1 immunoglobulin light chain junction region [Macaca mulatta]